MIINIHSRDFKASKSEVWDLVKSLATCDDKIWPTERWPGMILDNHFNIGSQGGHSLIRYYVEDYKENSHIKFRFTKPEGFNGTHEFIVTDIKPNVVRLEHRVTMKLNIKAKILWLLMIKNLHDALIEDALGKAELNMYGKELQYPSLSLWVRFLRYIIRRNQKAKLNSTM